MCVIRAYEIGVRDTEWTRIVHATSAGKAKYDYLRDVREAWPDISFKHLTCRSLGAPVTTEDFKRTATYRGVPFAKIGMRVEAGGWKGEIVGNNSSANFNILFLDGPNKGLTLNCHPNWMIKYFDEDGTVLAEFKKED